MVDLVTHEGAALHAGRRRPRARWRRFPRRWPTAAKEAHEKLVEMVAEGDDKLMEEFFEKGTLPVEDLDARVCGWRSRSGAFLR